MNDLIARFTQFVALPKLRPDRVSNMLAASLEALNSGEGSLELAFEFDVMARSAQPGSHDYLLLVEMAEALRAAAFRTTGGGYLPKGGAYLRH